MITCHRHHLEQRAAERGYAWEQVIQCIVSENGDTITVDETHAAYPHAKQGLGDIVAAGLSSVGITKERVSNLVGGDCGCAKRQEQLNALGRRVGIGR
jgi:hypothetical protein